MFYEINIALPAESGYGELWAVPNEVMNETCGGSEFLLCDLWAYLIQIMVTYSSWQYLSVVIGLVEFGLT